ncbi:nucleotidyltransferase family protein [Sphingorhabdus sp. YGSMI21]|uniref:nucleotidyltransferase family protein n=1 Tax=Sphingorhabdus sp. YGSMI21 TaxID=2077182 RepID=UPI000C1F801F|nr:nucleotidyltransferase family protein [Sphingorhabdus sp. YGSMI21]ATW03844.1 hypothetical protein CHN51_10085 [Sphingorhabdus sp. YGSMI21]
MDGNSEALLLSLSRYLRPALSLPLIDVSEPISETLATFAVSRHRVGPLLHLATQGSADVTADDNASSILETAYQNNIFAGLKQKAAEKNISKLLNAHSVPFSILKGRGLAEQLHDDSTARQSKDVDILISPDRTRQAIGLLNDQGYIYKPYSLRRKKMFELARQDMEIKLFKDLTFLDPTFSVPIELHNRLFAFEPKTLTKDFSQSIKFTLNPQLTESFYCLYLILHGALAMWPRLKWVVDLSIIARKMPAQRRIEMLNIAASYGCDEAVAASLLMVESVFAGSLDDEWQLLLNQHRNNERLHQIKNWFYESLIASEIGRSVLPLSRYMSIGSAGFVFPGNINIIENFFRRWMASLTIRI